MRHCAASRGGYGSLPPGRARRPVSVAHPGARTNFTSFRGHAFGGPWMQEVFLPLARTPPLAVTTRGNHTTLGHGPLPWVTVRNPIDPAGAVWLPPPNSAFKNACDSPTASRFTFNRAFFGKQVSAREIQGLPGIFPTASDVAPCATRRNRARGVVTRTESAHFRLSRFPAGYLAYLPVSAPATAATHSSPTTSPGGACSSAPAPEDSALVRPC